VIWVSVDVEADGPIPGDYSMIEVGAVVVESSLDRTFHGRLRPISEEWVPEALAVSGHSREDTLQFPSPQQVMEDFAAWLDSVSGGNRVGFIADNNGFDWMFVCWYFHHFIGRCPFGFSSANLNSLWKGMKRDMWKSFKHLRKTKHTHNPVDDAMGNAEALLAMKEQGLKIKLV
jgi:hypothetical protein